MRIMQRRFLLFILVFVMLRLRCGKRRFGRRRLKLRCMPRRDIRLWCRKLYLLFVRRGHVLI